LTLPVPVPLAGATVIQLALLDAVHAQPFAVVTVTAPDPPVESYAAVVGATEYEHPGVVDAAACVMVTVWPLTVIVPVRPVDAGFAATV